VHLVMLIRGGRFRLSIVDITYHIVYQLFTNRTTSNGFDAVTRCLRSLPLIKYWCFNKMCFRVSGCNLVKLTSIHPESDCRVVS